MTRSERKPFPRTTYEAELARLVSKRFGRISPGRLVVELYRIGVIDHTLCKTLMVRRWVEQAVRDGHRKTRAMWLASEYFCPMMIS